MPADKKKPNRKDRRAARFSHPHAIYPAVAMPTPTTFRRRIFIRLFRWKIRFRFFKSFAISFIESLRSGLAYLRTFSIVGILVGFIGLMQTLFWPSVISFYIGSAILCLDLMLEKFLIWVRIAAIAIILLIVFGFTHEVVLRSDSFYVVHYVAGDKMRVIITNPSRDELDNLDIYIRPDFPNLLVSDPHQVSSLPGVSFVDPPMPGIMTGIGENVTVQMNVSDTDPHPVKWIRANFLRIRCDHLPVNVSLVVEFSLSRGKGNTAVPVISVSRVTVDGSYKGRFREFSTNIQSVDMYQIGNYNFQEKK